jgi:hypothetical protein
MNGEMLIDETTPVNRPTTGFPPNYRGPMSATNIHYTNQLAPHALVGHQAASKKSFRIRGQAEQEMIKNHNSSKEIGIMDFNNGKFTTL